MVGRAQICLGVLFSFLSFSAYGETPSGGSAPSSKNTRCRRVLIVTVSTVAAGLLLFPKVRQIVPGETPIGNFLGSVPERTMLEREFEAAKQNSIDPRLPLLEWWNLKDIQIRHSANEAATISKDRADLPDVRATPVPEVVFEVLNKPFEAEHFFVPGHYLYWQLGVKDPSKIHIPTEIFALAPLAQWRALFEAHAEQLIPYMNTTDPLNVEKSWTVSVLTDLMSAHVRYLASSWKDLSATDRQEAAQNFHTIQKFSSFHGRWVNSPSFYEVGLRIEDAEIFNDLIVRDSARIHFYVEFILREGLFDNPSSRELIEAGLKRQLLDPEASVESKKEVLSLAKKFGLKVY